MSVSYKFRDSFVDAYTNVVILQLIYDSQMSWLKNSFGKGKKKLKLIHDCRDSFMNVVSRWWIYEWLRLW